MKVLFSVHHLGSFRMYESVVRALAARGHDVHVVIGRTDNQGWGKTLDVMVAEHPTLRSSWIESPSGTFWAEAAKTIRLWADYLRYFAPSYADTPKLMERAGERLPTALRWLSHRSLFANAWWRRRLLSLLRACERALPRVQAVEDLLEREQPDIVLITPLVYLASMQTDVLRSAIARGIRTGFCVGSWDHLSSKALIRDIPDRVFLWNETQRREAIELHGIPAERVVVTGAQCYDQWFGRRPSRSRDEFCRRVGLSAERPFLLYVGSALFRGSPVEAEFAARWVEQLRASGEPALRDVPVLVRPHPARMDEWNAVDLARYAGVVVYGSNPVDPDSKNDYFESLYYSAGIVGLNTSAFLEGAIVGRPAYTILLPEFRENQEGTLHFHYLLSVGGGVLHAARTWDGHHAQLAGAIRGEVVPSTTFVEAFVRPHGLTRPVTDVFVQEVERMMKRPEQSAVPETVGARLLRSLVIGPMLYGSRAVLGDRVMRSDWSRQARERTRRQEEQTRVRQARRERLLEVRSQRSAARERRISERDHRRELERLRAHETREGARREKQRLLQQQREQLEQEREKARLEKQSAREQAQREKLESRAAAKAKQLEEHRERKRAARESATAEGRRA